MRTARPTGTAAPRPTQDETLAALENRPALPGSTWFSSEELDDFIDAFKQRQSTEPAFRAAWGDWCDANRDGTRDPRKVPSDMLEAFIYRFDAQRRRRDRNPEQQTTRAQASSTKRRRRGRSGRDRRARRHPSPEYE